jgi:hypothetical protein
LEVGNLSDICIATDLALPAAARAGRDADVGEPLETPSSLYDGGKLVRSPPVVSVTGSCAESERAD